MTSRYYFFIIVRNPLGIWVLFFSWPRGIWKWIGFLNLIELKLKIDWLSKSWIKASFSRFDKISTFEFYIADALLKEAWCHQSRSKMKRYVKTISTRIEIDIHWIMEECWIEKLQLILSNIFWVLNFAKKESRSIANQ